LAASNLSALDEGFEIRSRLLPFTLEESRDYIEYHLQRAGGSAAQVFTPRAINLVIYHSGGIPRTLNQACYEALWVGRSQFKEKVDLESAGMALVNLGRVKEDPPSFS
jgi:type II secretory pathway predicted ATPase ExeA